MSVKKSRVCVAIRSGQIRGGIILILCVILAAGCISSSPDQETASLSPSSSVAISPISQALGHCPHDTAAGNVTTEPEIAINPLPDHALGDNVTFTGTTNLAVGEPLLLKVSSTEFTPCPKGVVSSDSVDPCSNGFTGTVSVSSGNCNVNSWVWSVDTSQHGFQPGYQYLLVVSGRNGQVQNATLFNILTPSKK
jgi:hypothetical protein